MRLGVVLLWLACAAAGCVRPALVDCPNSDLTCPAGYVCDDLHHTCLAPDQLASCAGLVDDMTCMVSTVSTVGTVGGYCRDQICVPIVCGNGVLDLSEVCDDGNQVGGDGCNATCSSTDLCGNAQVDADRAELCDDGNLVDGDGCDSSCLPEQARWSVTGVSVRGEAPGRMVYDAARQRMLYYASSTWGYTGGGWSLLTADGPADFYGKPQLVYIPERASVLYFGQQTSTVAIDDTWEWDGTSWTPFVVANPPPNLRDARITYDPVRHVILLVGAESTRVVAWSLDLQLTSWTPLPDVSSGFASFGTSAALAFDETRGLAVFVLGNNTYEWDGVAWTQIAAPPPTPIEGNVMFDPIEGALVATSRTATMRWDGAAWTTLAAQAIPSARRNAPVAWDPDRQRRVVFGGIDASNAPQPDSYEWDGAAWHHVAATDAPFLGNILLPARPPAYDPLRRALIQLGGPSPTMEAWAMVDGAWRRLPDGPFPGGSAMAFGYDPVREAMVVNTPGRGTWLLAGDTWTALEPEGTSDVFGLNSIVYDPTRGAMVGVGTTMTWELASTAQRWRAIAGLPINVDWRQSLVFDARANRVVLHTGSAVHDLVGDTWQSGLSPGQQVRAVASAVRGSVMFLMVGTTGGVLWERLDGNWRDLGTPPFRSWDARPFSTVDGALQVLVPPSGHLARLLYERRYVGVGASEACTGGDDDGDGLVDCADADCWFACTPACPPYASCAP